ncbi:MAG TPA: DUF6569 family protein [Candidatus Acidoferrales bacterium]|nr:DUF6569 family protein [Candidatus Acidoferrales bacterium]
MKDPAPNQSLKFTFGVAGILAVCALAAAIAANGRQSEKGTIEGWRLMEPVRYENLSVFPVVSKNGAETSGFLTLDEALSSGQAAVTERGSETMHRTRDGRPNPAEFQDSASVNQLVLVNRGKKPLILLAGELVSGGKQDRIIGKDRIVPVGAPPLPLDVFCVEHGRWTNGSEFSSASTIVHPSVRERAAVDQAQGQVWDAVRSGSTSKSSDANGVSGAGGRTAAPAPAPVFSAGYIDTTITREAPTQDYQKVYNNKQANQSIDPFVDEIQKQFAAATSNLKGEHVIGVVIAYGGEVAWSDVFASPELFQRYWPKLLRSYVVEALARPRLKEQATLADAQEFLRPLKGTEKTESEPDVYRWREITEGHYAEIELQSLRPTDILLHRLKIHRTT